MNNQAKWIWVPKISFELFKCGDSTEDYIDAYNLYRYCVRNELPIGFTGTTRSAKEENTKKEKKYFLEIKTDIVKRIKL
jgi:hypothetical protein